MDGSTIINQVGTVLLIIGGLILVGGLIFLSLWLEKKKREAFQREAARLELNYSHAQNSRLPEKFSFLNHLTSGSNEYAAHVVTGLFHELKVTVFEHHYETYSTDSKGNRTTDHHYHSVFAIGLPNSFPEVTIGPESFLSKIAQAVGYDDIDFESAEFSRKFCVRSKDKRFAYDVCHPLAIEFLLEHPDLNLEIEGKWLATVEDGYLSPEQIEPTLQKLVAFRLLLPEHLLTN